MFKWLFKNSEDESVNEPIEPQVEEKLKLGDTFHLIFAATHRIEEWGCFIHNHIKIVRHISGLTFTSATLGTFTFREAWANDAECKFLSIRFEHMFDDLFKEAVRKREADIKIYLKEEE